MRGSISRRRTSGRGSTGCCGARFGIVLPNPELVSRVDVGGAPGRAVRGAYARAAESRARARSLARCRALRLPTSRRCSRARGSARRRVALLNGCAQQVLAPQINEATIRLLTRHGCEVVVAEGAGCCGALTHHLGQDAHDYARANILAWTKEIAGGGLDAIVINASGCGTTVKDYGFMFRDDPELAEAAQIVSSLARDVTELMSEIGLQAHGQSDGPARRLPQRLLAAARAANPRASRSGC